MIRPGICSVTLRQLTAEQVVEVAAAAGLAAVEWGGDVHAPPESAEELARVRALTTTHGLAVASYGSYLRAGAGDDPHAPVLEAALALHAPRIRIWAGRLPSADADHAYRRRVVDATRALADDAAAHGVEVAFEFHARTLTDSVDSTLRLLEEVDRPHVRTYWQPNVGEPDDVALAGLDRLLPHVTTVHAFAWWPTHERLPLAERASLWREVAARLRSTGRDHDVLLEFVPDDDPAVVAREAETLRDLLGLE